MLSAGDGQVSSRALEHGTQGIGRAAKPSGQSVRIVDCHEKAVDLIHTREQRLSPGEVVTSYRVEDLTPQLACGFGQRVEIRWIVHTKRIRVGDWLSSDQCLGKRCFREFFHRILDVPGPS